MSYNEIDVMLAHLFSWRNAYKNCKEAFAKHMQGRRYGYEALSDAYLWFVTGWNARSEV